MSCRGIIVAPSQAKLVGIGIEINIPEPENCSRGVDSSRAVFRFRDVYLDPDFFYPPRIPDPTRATNGGGGGKFLVSSFFL